MTNVIICGGNGTRLWPISRENLPKQFLKMFDEQSLYQMTIKVNSKICEKGCVVSNANQFFLALDQFEDIKSEINWTRIDAIVEPFGRNTAAAIAFSAFLNNDILFVTPSDHKIEANEKYYEAIKKAEKFANDGFLVVFGVKPQYPETGYGYIESDGDDVIKFHEKPDLKTAEEYIKSGNFYWNSGMFMFKSDVYLEELKKYAPDVYEGAKEAFENAKNGEYIRILSKYMQQIPDISIDYAVMEKSKKIKFVELKTKWNDVGSFDALYQEFEKDENGNTKKKNLVAIESKNNFVFGRYKTIALSNVNDLVIVDTPTALLVTKKGKSQTVKDIVKILKEKNPDIVKFGRTVYRPWGYFTNLLEGDKYKVKLLKVEPNKRLSLQKHFHRSEHWTVVSGTATIIKGDKKFLLRPNESTYIPMGEVHRIENNGKIPVEIIEVQVGEYLGEDDIVRFEDDFGRS